VPTTPCISKIRLPIHSKLPIDVTFDAPRISSDGGALLLRQIDERLALCARVGAEIPDTRSPSRVVHSRAEQIRQRVFQIVLGYEDANDADTLRRDPLLNVACDRLAEDPRGLSSQPSLSRLEHAPTARDVVRMQRILERAYVEQLPADTTHVVLDVDTTDDPTHGQQPLSFFNAHYDTSMYYPIVLFDGEGRLVSVRLRPGNAGNHRYATPMLDRIIRMLKTRFPRVHIMVRADSSFAAPRLLDRLDELNTRFDDIEYLIGIQKNPTLLERAADVMRIAEERFKETGRPQRFFAEFAYAARSWKRERCVIVKAEHIDLKPNPRFIITSLRGFPPSVIYERAYCARGQAENYLKDFKRALSADRLSCTTYVANAFRLILHAVAYRIMHALRISLAPHAPALATAQFDTIRLRLLKVAALVSQSVRRIVVALPRAFPFAHAFRVLASTLAAAHLMPA
jgi:hypothetical protein